MCPATLGSGYSPENRDTKICRDMRPENKPDCNKTWKWHDINGMPLGMCFTAGITLIITLYPTMFKMNHCLYFVFPHRDTTSWCFLQSQRSQTPVVHVSWQQSVQSEKSLDRMTALCEALPNCNCVCGCYPSLGAGGTEQRAKKDTYLLLYWVWSFFNPVAVSFRATPVKC